MTRRNPWTEHPALRGDVVRTRLGIAPNHASFRAGVLRTHMLAGLAARAAAQHAGTEAQIFARSDDSDAKRSGTSNMPALLAEIADVAQVPIDPIPAQVQAGGHVLYASGRTARYQEALDALCRDGVAVREGPIVWCELTRIDEALVAQGMDPIKLVTGSLANVSIVPSAHPEPRVPLTRSDGSALWHLTTVVDDIDLAINLIVRATDKLAAVAVQERMRWALTSGAQRVAYLFVPRLLEPGHAGRGHTGGDRTAARLMTLQRSGIRPSAIRWYLAEPFCAPATGGIPTSFDELAALVRTDGWPMHDALFDPERLAAVDRKVSAQLQGKTAERELRAFLGGDIATPILDFVLTHWPRPLREQAALCAALSGAEVNRDPAPAGAAAGVDWCEQHSRGRATGDPPASVRWVLTGKHAGPCVAALLEIISPEVSALRAADARKYL